MKSIGNAGAERLLFSSFQLSPLLSSLFFLSSFLFDLELEHGRSSSGPISLNSRGVHEVCEMAEGNPEVRRRGGGRARSGSENQEKRRRREHKRKRNVLNPPKIYRMSLAQRRFIPEHSFLNAGLLLISLRSVRHAIPRANEITSFKFCRAASCYREREREMSESLDRDTRRE